MSVYFFFRKFKKNNKNIKREEKEKTNAIEPLKD
jgi:hypothetical protein